MKTSIFKAFRIFFKLLTFFIICSASNINIFAQEDGIDSSTVKREQWFYSQRSYPLDTIPRFANGNAIDQSIYLKNSQGYYQSAQDNWISIGPNPMNLSINGWDYCSGRVSMILSDPNNSSNIFLAGAGGGVWKSVNGGLNWNALPNDYCSASGCLAIDPTNSQIIYYGTGEMHYGVYSYYGNGLLKSTDGGSTWRQITNGLPNRPTYFSKIAIRPGHSNELLAACGTNYANISYQSGLYRSTDYGESWTKIVPSANQYLLCTDVAFSTDANGSKAYVVGPNLSSNNVWERGVEYRISYDGGATFGNPLPTVLEPDGRPLISVSKANPNIVYVITNSGEFSNKLYKSVNAGENFTLIHNFNGSWDYQGWYNLLVAASPYNENVVFCGTNNLYRSMDGGQNFTDIAGYGSGSVHADMHYLEFSSSSSEPNTIYLGNDGGAWKSYNLGTNWTNLNSTLVLSHIYRIGSIPFVADNTVGGVQDMGFAHRYGGVSWNDYGRGYDGGNFAFSQTNAYSGVGIETPGGEILYTTNYGTTLNGTSISGTWDNQNDWLAPIVAHPTQEGVFYTARRYNNSVVRVWKTTDNGASWFGLPNDISNFDPPQNIAICNTVPDYMYVSVGSYVWPSITSKVFKTTNGGNTWENNSTPLVLSGLPNRYISHLEVDPSNPDILYLTVSGFNESTPGYSGHVFKSTNGGASVVDLSGTPPPNGNGLPNSPTSDMVIRDIDCNTREIIVATDVGVFKSIDNGSATWQTFANLLPTAVAMDLDYSPLTGKLRVATFGRGVWETDVAKSPGTIYVKGNQNISSDANGILIDQNIVVCSGGHLRFPNGCLVIMGADKKITVMDGGQITAGSGNTVTLTSSGLWNGIEFQGNSYGTLDKCIINATNTPITVNSSAGGGPGGNLPPRISITYCTFGQGPITINNRGNVFIDNCTWNYANAPSSTVCGVSVTGAPSVTVQWSSISIPPSIGNTVTAISVVQSTGASISRNTIRNTNTGIFASNCDANIRFSDIGVNGSTSAQYGLALDNCANSQVNWNVVTSYQTGISLTNYSSAVMHDNNVTGSSLYGLSCGNGTNPRMTPAIDNGNVIWDAGLNILETTTNGGTGLYINNNSTPNMAEGYNTVWGGNCYIDGVGSGKWSVTDNCWVDNPPVSGKFCVTGFQRFTYIPYSCTPPPGAGGESGSDGDNLEPIDPPQPLIVDYGNGVIDTLKAGSSSVQLSADMQLFNHAVKQSLESNFTDAINTYKQVIQNYRDSLSAVESMKKIFYCYSRMNADTTALTDLRNYYLELISPNSAETAFTKTANELSRKCLVKKMELENAIGEYENAVQHSTNHADSVSAEVNIIEVYMLMQSTGGYSRFTGRMSNLKPLNVMDGLRMIKEKLYNIHDAGNIVEIPTSFSLSQNYPNPFNPSTRIKFALPSAEKVTLKIYDILGRMVKTLVNNEFKDAGYYEILFDATNFASGVYFYRIEMGKFVQSKKMVVLK